MAFKPTSYLIRYTTFERLTETEPLHTCSRTMSARSPIDLTHDSDDAPSFFVKGVSQEEVRGLFGDMKRYLPCLITVTSDGVQGHFDPNMTNVESFPSPDWLKVGVSGNPEGFFVPDSTKQPPVFVDNRMWSTGTFALHWPPSQNAATSQDSTSAGKSLAWVFPRVHVGVSQQLGAPVRLVSSTSGSSPVQTWQPSHEIRVARTSPRCPLTMWSEAIHYSNPPGTTQASTSDVPEGDTSCPLEDPTFYPEDVDFSFFRNPEDYAEFFEDLDASLNAAASAGYGN